MSRRRAGASALRRISPVSLEIFRRVRHYTPLLVPTSIDEGFLDFTDSPRVFRCRTPAELVARMKCELAAKSACPCRWGWARRVGWRSCPPSIANPTAFAKYPKTRNASFSTTCRFKNSRASPNGARYHCARWASDARRLTTPVGLLEKRYGFFGLELWLLATGQLRERLSLANKPRTCIGSATTLPYDEPDYETALLFLFDQTEKS